MDSWEFVPRKLNPGETEEGSLGSKAEAQTECDKMNEGD